MQKICKYSALCLLLLLGLSGMNSMTVVGSSAETIVPSSSPDYRWLLSSPTRVYLSDAAEFYLMLRYGELRSAQIKNHAASAGSLSKAFQTQFFPFGDQGPPPPANVLVNDPTRDYPNATVESEPSIAVAGQHIVVGWKEWGTELMTSWAGYGYSTDGGRTFTDGGVLPPLPGGGFNFADAALAAYDEQIFYYAHLAITPEGKSIVAVRKSTDGGKTFSLPVNASPGTTPRSFQDKELITVDNTRGRFDGNIYASWTEFPPGDSSRILFSRSRDGGKTFSKPTALTDLGLGRVVQGSMPTVGPNGEVYVIWWEANPESALAGPDHIKLRRSVDGGVTFEEAVTVATLQPIGVLSARCGGGLRNVMNGYIRSYEASQFIAVDRSHGPNRGNLYVTYASHPGNLGYGDMSDIFFTRSTDGGHTWSVPRRVNDDQTMRDQWMPFVAVSGNGTVGVMWYDRRRDPNNMKIDVYMATSNDGGLSFSKNRRITTQSFGVPTPCPDPLFNSSYMGDYNYMATDEENFYLVWGDNRNTITVFGVTRPDPDVYFARVIAPTSHAASRLSAGALAMTALQVSSNLTMRSHTIEFKVEGQGIEAVKLEVFDLAGHRIFDSGLLSGQRLQWHLQTDAGQAVANGAYLYTVMAYGQGGASVRSEVKKLVILR